jgi:predicted nucleotidyltransferase component of viral defense system
MLQTATIQSNTLELLNELMAFPPLNSFYLAGGTALALEYGHRLSVDIDLFVDKPFDQEAILVELQHHFDPNHLQVLNISNNSINCIIQNVKVDLLAHQYPIIDKPIVEDNIRLLSIADIAAMKIGAASGRGSKKDFFDLHELLQHYSLAELLGFYKQKYSQNDIWFIVRSLTYFEDAEHSEEPIVLNKQLWSQVKHDIVISVENYLPQD